MAATLRPTGIVAHWRSIWLEWSTWLLGALALAPDILASMVAQGWLTPAESGAAFKAFVALTIAAKYVKQKKAPGAPVPDDDRVAG